VSTLFRREIAQTTAEQALSVKRPLNLFALLNTEASVFRL